MAFRKFKHIFHEGFLTDFKFCQAEATFDIILNTYYNKDTSSARLWIGGIENIEEVTAFFERLPPPECADAGICELQEIEYSKERSNWVLFSTLNHGTILIRSNHVSEF